MASDEGAAKTGEDTDSEYGSPPGKVRRVEYSIDDVFDPDTGLLKIYTTYFDAGDSEVVDAARRAASLMLIRIEFGSTILPFVKDGGKRSFRLRVPRVCTVAFLKREICRAVAGYRVFPSFMKLVISETGVILEAFAAAEGGGGAAASSSQQGQQQREQVQEEGREELNLPHWGITDGSTLVLDIVEGDLFEPMRVLGQPCGRRLSAAARTAAVVAMRQVAAAGPAALQPVVFGDAAAGPAEDDAAAGQAGVEEAAAGQAGVEDPAAGPAGDEDAAGSRQTAAGAAGQAAAGAAGHAAAAGSRQAAAGAAGQAAAGAAGHAAAAGSRQVAAGAAGQAAAGAAGQAAVAEQGATGAIVRRQSGAERSGDDKEREQYTNWDVTDTNALLEGIIHFKSASTNTWPKIKAKYAAELAGYSVTQMLERWKTLQKKAKRNFEDKRRVLKQETRELVLKALQAVRRGRV